MAHDVSTDKQARHSRRRELLARIDRLTDGPMIVLAFVWLGLLIVEFTVGLNEPLQRANLTIWALFILDFTVGFTVAPRKGEYLRRNWLTVVSLLLPAARALRVFRSFRVVRAARFVRSLNLLRLMTSLNRGMRAAGAALGRRGVGYVTVLTLIVTLTGAAGMALLESRAAGGDLDTYGDALWWTAMIMTTLGSDYWPRTAEGRALAWLLAVYAFAIFGYLTATIASVIIGRPAEPTPAAELAELRDEIRSLRALLEARTPAPPVTVRSASHAHELPTHAADERVSTRATAPPAHPS